LLEDASSLRADVSEVPGLRRVASHVWRRSSRSWGVGPRGWDDAATGHAHRVPGRHATPQHFWAAPNSDLARTLGEHERSRRFSDQRDAIEPHVEQRSFSRAPTYRAATSGVASRPRSKLAEPTSCSARGGYAPAVRRTRSVCELISRSAPSCLRAASSICIAALSARSEPRVCVRWAELSCPARLLMLSIACVI
jgi:hypothetical protein